MLELVQMEVMSMQLNAFGRLDIPASVVLFAGLGGSCVGMKHAWLITILAVAELGSLLLEGI